MTFQPAPPLAQRLLRLARRHAMALSLWAVLWASLMLLVLGIAHREQQAHVRQTAETARTVLLARLAAAEHLLSLLANDAPAPHDTLHARAAHLQQDFPFVYVMGRQPYIPRAARADYEKTLSLQYGGPVRIRDFRPPLGQQAPWRDARYWQVAPERDYYLPLTQTAPDRHYPARFMVGLDLLANPSIGTAVRRSLRSAALAITEPLTLSNGERGVILVEPILRRQPRLTDNRRDNLALDGIALIALSSERLLSGVALPAEAGVRLAHTGSAEAIPLAAPARTEPRLAGLAGRLFGTPGAHLPQLRPDFPYRVEVQAPALPGNFAAAPWLAATAALAALMAAATSVLHTRYARARRRHNNPQPHAASTRRREDALLEGVTDAVLVVDSQRRIVALNTRALEMAATTRALAEGTRIDELLPLHIELATRGDDPLSECLARQTRVSLPAHAYVDTPAGKQYIEGRLTPFGGGALIALTLLPDADEGDARHRRDERLHAHASAYAQSARASSLAEMASGIAHEINQPLSAINSYNEAALAMLEDGDADPILIRTALEGSLAQVERAGHIVRGLRNFVAARRPELISVDVNQAVRNALLLAAPELRYTTTHVNTRLANSLPRVQADPIQLEQVLLNLIRNALDATGSQTGWGRITIASEACTGGVRVRVSDSGPGIPADVLPRIFDPFYSGKSQGGGMGLGLTISQTLIESFGGTLYARNLAEGGAEFMFELPVPRFEEPPCPTTSPQPSST
ncbi:ATP-binding protein [Crenobacter intestini]|uniref:histidine kinase n=1 Tax=Crenobacter intestini TaxID=2563443 RepID=A0A4T0V6L4_9NEIS|nr:ATP-binding protein [Crenobacter intestini]TIC87091.1 PAS domain-containing protein [Crenobacter intestini]